MAGQRFLIPLFLINALFIAPPAAQGQPSEEAPLIEVEWRAISVGQTLRDLFLLGQQGESEKIFIPNGALSPTYTYRGTDPMVLYRQDPASEEPNPIPVASVSLARIEDEAILFVSPNPDGSSLRVESFSVESETLRKGHTRLINLTQYTIGGFHGGTRFDLNPGGSTTLPFNTEKAGGVIKVSIQIAAFQEEAWRAKLNSTFGVTPDMSVNLLLIPSDDNGVQMIPLRERNAETRQVDPKTTNDS